MTNHDWYLLIDQNRDEMPYYADWLTDNNQPELADYVRINYEISLQSDPRIIDDLHMELGAIAKVLGAEIYNLPIKLSHYHHMGADYDINNPYLQLEDITTNHVQIVISVQFGIQTAKITLLKGERSLLDSKRWLLLSYPGYSSVLDLQPSKRREILWRRDARLNRNTFFDVDLSIHDSTNPRIYSPDNINWHDFSEGDYGVTFVPISKDPKKGYGKIVLKNLLYPKR